MNSSLKGTPISLPLRVWLVVEVFFGVAAVLSIGLAPDQTKANFAWPIQAVVMAAVLGGFYITSAPLFLLPLFAKRWEMIRVIVLPAILFTTVQLILTFLHWDKFSVGSTPFYVWFASYLLPPPIFLAIYLWQQRQAKGQSIPISEPLAPTLRRLLVILGSIILAGAVLVFLVPSVLIPIFPWPLTPLTARTLTAWLMAVGGLLLMMARENDRTRVRLATPMLILLLPALLLQILRYADQVNWASPTLWVGLLLLASVGAIGLALAKGSWRAALS